MQKSWGPWPPLRWDIKLLLRRPLSPVAEVAPKAGQPLGQLRLWPWTVSFSPVYSSPKSRGLYCCPAWGRRLPSDLLPASHLWAEQRPAQEPSSGLLSWDLVCGGSVHFMVSEQRLSCRAELNDYPMNSRFPFVNECSLSLAVEWAPLWLSCAFVPRAPCSPLPHPFPQRQIP